MHALFCKSAMEKLIHIHVHRHTCNNMVYPPEESLCP